MLAPVRRTGRVRTFSIVVVALVVLGAACGGGGSSKKSSGTSSSAAGPAKPQYGGSITYGLEAESTGGYCLPHSTLAISGIEVAYAVYDTLVTLDDKGQVVPFLAKSFDHNADYTEYTFGLRQGVKFHDGTSLDANAVKMNLDAYRNSPPLFTSVLEPIKDVTVVDPLTVKVTMKRSWPEFGWPLTVRMGMAAAAQLNDPKTCSSHMIGTGPFKLKEWVPNDHLTAVKNPDYWQKGLPYLDQITFKIVVEASGRVDGVRSGALDVSHNSNGKAIAQLEDLAKSKQINIVQEGFHRNELYYFMLNVSKPPFDDLTARQAVAAAIDRKSILEIGERNVQRLAEGPFAKDVEGYLPDPGFPKFDLAKAQDLVNQYKAKHGDLKVRVLLGQDPNEQAEAQLLKEQLEKAGMTVDLKSTDQSTEISDALTAQFSLLMWRNNPGGDPDVNGYWWHSASPLNFGRINDPQIDQGLDTGRPQGDRTQAAPIYEALNRRFASQLYNIWMWYVNWTIATRPNVHGIVGVPLPSGGHLYPMIAGYHQVVGIWVDK